MKFTPIPSHPMSDRFQKLGALSFALIAVSMSGSAIYNAFSPEERVFIPTLLGQAAPSQEVPIIEHNIPDGGYAILPANTHNFVECENTSNQPLVNDEGLDEHTRFWAYEFTGNEPPFNGDFYISTAELEVNPYLSSINDLWRIQDGRRYYIMSERDLYISCSEGIRSASVARVIETSYATPNIAITELPVQLMKFKIETDRDSTLRDMAFNQRIHFADDDDDAGFPDAFFSEISLRIDTNRDGRWDIIIPIDQKHRQSIDRPISEISITTPYPIAENESVYFEIWGEQIEPGILDNVEAGEEMSISFSFPEPAMWGQRGQYYIEIDDIYDALEGRNNWNIDGYCYEGYDVVEDAYCFHSLETKLPPIVHPVQMVLAVCGNGTVEGEEECDDSNTANRDGCDNECRVEVGYSCTGDRSTCSFMFPSLPTSGSAGSSSTGRSEPNCEDDDPREDIYFRGTARLGDGDPITDGCLDSGELIQYHCSFGFMEGLRTQCEFGCTDGICDNHFTCDSETLQCKRVNGAGPDECDSNDDCRGGGSGAPGPSGQPGAPGQGPGPGGNDDDNGPGPGPAPGTPPAADLVLSAPNLQPEIPVKGQTFSVTHIISNDGPDATDSIAFTARFPRNVLFATQGSSEECEFNSQFGIVECTFGRTANGASVRLVLNFTIPETGCESDIQYFANVDGPFVDLNTDNNTYVGNVIVNCDDHRGDTLAQLVTIRDANPETPRGQGSNPEVPPGLHPVGQFKFTNLVGRDTFILDSVIFQVAAHHVAMRTDSFKLYNKSDATNKTNCTPHYATGQPFPAPSTAGVINLLVECDLEDVSVDTDVPGGFSSTFVLEVMITNPNTTSNAPQPQDSDLQIILTNFSNPNLGYGRDAYGNYIRWVSRDAAGNHTAPFSLVLPTDGTTSVPSTFYESQE